VLPSWREVVVSLYGAWRLARLDPRGLGFFDATSEGALRSFFAAVLVAPLYVVMLAVVLPGDAPGGPLRVFLAESIGYVTTWTAYPVIVEGLSRILGCRPRFEGYLAAYNWSMVLQHALIVPISILVGLGLLPLELGQFLWMVAFSLILAYLWFIARTGLALPPLTAAGLVLLDVLLSALIDGIAAGMS
jgi:hypothetical protein